MHQMRNKYELLEDENEELQTTVRRLEIQNKLLEHHHNELTTENHALSTKVKYYTLFCHTVFY